MGFSENLKNLRIQKGYTQEELAKIIGVSDSLISLYETGKRSPELSKGVKLAQVLGTTCEELVAQEQVYSS